MDVALLASRNFPSNRLRAAIELAIVLGLLEAELWSLRGWAPAWLNISLSLILIATVALSIARRHAAEMSEPQRVASPRRSWAEATGACLVLSTILLVAAALIGDANETFEFVFLQKPPLKLLNWLIGKFGAALGQQLALQWFLGPVCREITNRRSVGTLLAALIFGLVHLPSPTLVAITFLAGVVWMILYQRSGRLAPLVVSHMILATLAHGGLPERLTCDMRVGITAIADQDRFEALEDPKTRLINRRLKDHRDDLRYFTSDRYYQTQGGTDSALIRGLFRDIMGRPATDSDLEFWRNQKLDHFREKVPSIFLASDEFARIEADRRASGQPSSLRR